MADLIEAFQAGQRRALARAITWAENDRPQARQLIEAVYPQTGRAHVIGITGPPGAGKSTLVDRLAVHIRQLGHSVAIVAVDPSSPFTGGAILGDRIRMQRSLAETDIFMRSVASRGHLGGLSITTGDVTLLMDAFGFDVILVETVGAGQSEVEIMALAHTTLVVLVPGMGDDIQAIKAGILEIGDVFVVNKADRDGASRVVTEIEMMLDLGHTGNAGINRWPVDGHNSSAGRNYLDPTGHHADLHDFPAATAKAVAPAVALRHGEPRPGGVSWRPPVVTTVAKDDQGVDGVVSWSLDHLKFLRESGRWQLRQRLDAGAKLRELIGATVVRDVLEKATAAGDLERAGAAVAARELDPYTAAQQILHKHFFAR